MSTGALFVTATSADVKAINRILLYMRDWDGYEGHIIDQFKLITSHTVPNDSSATVPPVLETDNEWAGKSIADVEAFVLLHARSYERQDVDLSLPITVEEQGLRDGTCIIMNRPPIWHDGDPHQTMEYADHFEKLRLPWEQVWSVHANLQIGNMDWEEFVDEEAGIMEDGCFAFTKQLDRHSSDDVSSMRDAALKTLKASGHA